MNTQKIVLITAGVLLTDYIMAQSRKPKIIIKDRLPMNYNAITLPPFGIYVTANQKDNKKLLQHELVHWKQYQQSGAILFGIRYLIEKIIFGYDKMPLEVEARKLTGESDFCQKNYTQCVRNGQAITVNNPNFIK